MQSLGAVRSAVTLRPAAASPPPAPLSVIGPPAIGAGLAVVNAQPKTIAPIGCGFVRDVMVSGPGYTFHGEQQITDGSHLSGVAVEWANRPMPDSPLAAPPAVELPVHGLCVVATGPGHLIYGHWLVDFIPRFMIARDVLGREFAKARFAMPHDTPEWALAMLALFAGVTRERCFFFRRGSERLAVEEACLPSYVHTEYHFHPYMRELVGSVGTPASTLGRRKLCISRAAFEKHTHGMQKLFSSRERFERMAGLHGYEVVRPEAMSLLEQVAMFRSASHVVGEYGSALHGTIFGPPGMRIGFIRCPNAIQLRISALCGHSSVVMMPEDDRVAPNGVQEYSLNDGELAAFFAALEA